MKAQNLSAQTSACPVRLARRYSGGPLAFKLVLAVVLSIVNSAPASAATFSLTLQDAVTAQPVTGAHVVVQGIARTAAQREGGTYALPDLPPGRYRIQVTSDGYRSAIVGIEIPGSLRLRLYRNNDATDLQTIASVRSSSTSGANGTVLHTTLTSVQLDTTATFRLADALLNLPELSASAITANATNMSPASSPQTTPLMGGPGSYVQMSLRGFGTIESPALIDGHPIGQGVDLGFDYQDAPTFGLGSVFVGYGTDAAALYGVSGAGVIDMRTLSPSAQPSFDLLQGAGSYDRTATAIRSTGTTANGRIGWAFAYGVVGSGGPLSGNYYAPTASLDSSNPHDDGAATYAFSDDTNRRNLLGKLVFTLGNATTLTVKAFNATAWADGTGDNSDAIYMPTGAATAYGKQLLESKTPSDTCSPGTFQVYNQLGEPAYVPCQTPQQYGSFNTGFQGIGPHYVAERASDYSATLSTTYETLDVSLDLFTNSYYWNYNRDGALPYSDPQYPFGSQILPYLSVNQLVVNTGGSLTVDKPVGEHDPYIAVYMMQNSNLFSSGPSGTAPFVASSSMGFGDHWSLAAGRVDVDAGGAFTNNSSTPDGSWFNPHLSVSAAITPRDRVRFSGGSSTISPAALWLDTPFAPTSLSTFKSLINCSSPNSVGNVPSSSLIPERIGDQELTASHDWGAGAFTAVDVYSARLADKIYAATIPVALLPAGTIPSWQLAPYRKALSDMCGRDSTLAASGNFNVGAVRATGADLMGRMPVPRVRHLSLNYGYSVESSVLESVNTPWFLPYNLSFIPGSQLPGVPLHQASLALDYTRPGGIDAALWRYWTSVNNPSNLPAYAVSNLEIGIPLSRSLRLRLMVDNLFNENANSYALSGLGYPAPLNRYASAANYAPYSGYGATVLAPLAPRDIFFNFDLKN